jgi:hypothetical protein
MKIAKSGGWRGFDMRWYVAETTLPERTDRSRVLQTAALAVAGDALTSNIYLDIPPLIRGLQHCFLAARPGATKISLHQQMLTMLREVKPDPRNPSSVVNEYSHAWWTQAGKGEMKRHELIDSGAAFEFHQDKVS